MNEDDFRRIIREELAAAAMSYPGSSPAPSERHEADAVLEWIGSLRPGTTGKAGDLLLLFLNGASSARTRGQAPWTAISFGMALARARGRIVNDRFIERARTRNGAYTTVTGLGMPVLTRKLTSGATTGTVYWTAYAKVNSNSGDIKISTSHSGVSSVVNVTSTSYAWTTPQAISIDCEDMSAADGRQSSSWDELDINIRGNSGGTLSLAAVSIYEIS